MIENVILSVFWVSAILWVLYNTDAVYEYISQPPLRWISKLITKLSTDDYQYHVRNNGLLGTSYKEFLLEHHSTFLLRIFSCPFCLGVWISLPICWWFGCLMWLPVVYFGAILFHFSFILVVDKIIGADHD